jgi:hypothetical protein
LIALVRPAILLPGPFNFGAGCGAMVFEAALVVAGAIAATSPARAPSIPDTGITAVTLAPADTAILRLERIPTDTPHARARAIEISDWYERRLTIHRYVAYGTIPVFAAQWIAGEQLLKESRNAPTWAKTTHRVGATMLAGMFTVNTVTGLWNWWDSRAVPQNRVLRTVHAFSMIAADAAFSYTGAKLSNEAETSSSARTLHHQVALISMGVTVVSGAAMKLWNK